MLKIVPAVILLGLIVGCGPQAARAADIQIFADPAIPELSGNYLIHIDGLIEDGDADKLEAVVADLPKGRDNFLLVALNSPGGNLAEGLRMADVLQAAEIQVVTDVMGFGGTPADCASACSLVYLGGTYRYLQEGPASASTNLRSRPTISPQNPRRRGRFSAWRRTSLIFCPALMSIQASLP
ncbi:ATP-dependent Clp protease proteolytic subunit [Gemmobacter lanyuensis]